MSELAELSAFARKSEASARSELRSSRFWRAIADLGVCETTADLPLRLPETPARDALRRDVATRGYATIEAAVSPAACAPLARAILALCDRGWDAAFVLVYDDAWRLARPLLRLVHHVVNERLVFGAEMFAFCVDPRRPGARLRGVPPHRDRERSGHDQVGDLRLPRHCTSWLALTDATVANGCIHVVPEGATGSTLRLDATRSPNGDHGRGTPPSVALEAAAGTVLVWGGQVLHWGGVHAGKGAPPRIALATAATDPEIAARSPMAGFSLSTLPDGPLPSLEQRLHLIKTISTFLYPPAPGSPLATVFSLF